MDITPLQATGSHFRDAGMSAPACSPGLLVESLTCITTAATWVSCTFLSRGNMLGKPTVHNSWEVASVSGKPEPCANTTRNRPRSPASRGCQSVLAFRTKQELLAAEALRFEQVNRHVNGIASARTFIQPSSLST